MTIEYHDLADFFAIETRRVHLAGITANRAWDWTTQTARWLGARPTGD